MNKVILMGRLTADPEIRQTAGGDHHVAYFTLAVDRRVAKDSETRADFIRCSAWDKKAEFCDKYLHKGSKIVFSGRVQTGSYKDKDDKTVYTTDFVAEDLEFAESKKDSTQAPASDGNGFMSIPDNIAEELPFN